MLYQARFGFEGAENHDVEFKGKRIWLFAYTV